MPPSFDGWTRVSVHAALIAERFDLRALHPGQQLSSAPATLPIGTDGLAVVFRYGAVVLFNLDATEEAAAERQLLAIATAPIDEPEQERSELRCSANGSERVGADGVIQVRKATLERLVVVADVLAKSVVLAFYENRVARVFDRIEPVARDLGRRSFRRERSMRNLLDHIGDVLLTQHRMVGRVEVTERPDLLWDHPELERLYDRLADVYELAERDRALTRKLDLIAQTAGTSLGLVQARRSLRVEWYIVILIVVDIVLGLIEKFFGSGGG